MPKELSTSDSRERPPSNPMPEELSTSDSRERPPAEATAEAPSTRNSRERSEAMPEELSTRHLKRRLGELAVIAVAVVALVALVPGLGDLRHRFTHARAAWIAAGAVVEVASCLSYVVVFRAVFCPRMRWRRSYQIGMAEQAANSLLPAGGAGGLALGVWALRRDGMPSAHIAPRTVAFFLLTSLANVSTLFVAAVGLAVGLLHGKVPLWVALACAAATLGAAATTLALPALSARHARRRKPPSAPRREHGGTLGEGLRALSALPRRVVEGAGLGVALLRTGDPQLLGGSYGYMGFDIAALWACFEAFGHAPPLGALVLAYLVGQLGGLLPLPGGLGGIDGGLIGMLVVVGTPVALATVAVLAYRTLALWIPGVLGTFAFVGLRHSVRAQDERGGICAPLAQTAAAALEEAGDQRTPGPSPVASGASVGRRA